MNTFDKDLAFGKQAENKIANFFKQFFNVEQMEGLDKGKDMIVSGGIEVKYDRQATKTGNYAIEIKSNGNNSGILTTTATAWVLCTDEGAWMVGTDILQNTAIEEMYLNNKETIKAGDNAEILLISYEYIKTFYKLI